jgi:fumarate reductase subunit D
MNTFQNVVSYVGDLFTKTASAQAFQADNASNLLGSVSSFISKLVPFIIALTVLFFLWGIFRLVFSAKDSDARAEARGFIIWGVIGIAVMVSVWGLVNFLSGSFALNNTVKVDNLLPPIPGAK